MRTAFKLVLFVGLGLSTATPLTAQMILPKTAPVPGDKLFGQQCGACHSVKPGETRVGPSLAGVVGRKAASYPDYEYSIALKALKITWTSATLDSWLSNSQAEASGAKMTYAQADGAKRKAIIDYLSSLPGK